MSKHFPPIPNLEFLRNEAKDLLAAQQTDDPQAYRRIRGMLSKFSDSPDSEIATEFSLEGSQSIVAREKGFSNWTELKSYIKSSGPRERDLRILVGAVENGDLQAVEDLLAKDPTLVNPACSFEPVLLFHVSIGVYEGTNTKGNQAHIAKKLIEAGADVDAEAGMALGGGAASLGVIEMAEVLLDAGASINGPNADGKPLCQAVWFGNDKVAELLAHRGAFINLPNAAGLGRVDLMEQFFRPDDSLSVEAGRMNYRQEDNMPSDPSEKQLKEQSFVYACRNDRIEAANLLLRKGVSINARWPLETSGLHHAIERGKKPVVEFLILGGADLDMRDERFDATPLGWAAHFEQDQIAELLRQHGATK